MAVNMLLAMGHTPLRRALVKALSEAEDIRTTGEVNKGAAALALAASVRPDVILADSILPDLESLVRPADGGHTCPLVMIVHTPRGVGGRIDDALDRLPLRVTDHVCSAVTSDATIDDLLHEIRTAASHGV